MATKPKAKYRAAAAPFLLDAMCRASQEGLPPGDWLAAARKRPTLCAAIEAYAPGAIGSPAKFAAALRAIEGQTFEYGGENLVLKSRYVNRRHQRFYGVAGSLRQRILKARDIANARESAIQTTAHEVAKQLRAGKPLAELQAVIDAAKPGHYSPVGASAREQALEETRAANWLPELRPTPAVAPVVLEPVPAPVPVVEATEELPGAWKTKGRPSYHTTTHEAPDDSFNGALSRKGGSKFQADPNIRIGSPLPK